MSRIEVLFEEFANLYGDRGNIHYIKEVGKDVEVIYTGLKDKPKFLTEHMDLVYLGPTTEEAQGKLADILAKYKEEIKEKIEEGTNFLVVGNSLELFGDYIEKIDGSKIKGLGIFDVYAKRITRLRHNDLVMGHTVIGNMEIVGFKNQMSHLYGVDNNYFLNLEYGCGRNKETKKEGIKYKNFIGTYVIGPILALNPDFASNLMDICNIKEDETILKEDAILAHDKRVREFTRFMNNKK